MDDQDASPHGEKVSGDVFPISDGGLRRNFAETKLGAVEGPAEECQRLDGGMVVERPVREGGDGDLVRVADEEDGAAVQQSDVLGGGGKIFSLLFLFFKFGDHRRFLKEPCTFYDTQMYMTGSDDLSHPDLDAVKETSAARRPHPHAGQIGVASPIVLSPIVLINSADSELKSPRNHISSRHIIDF